MLFRSIVFHRDRPRFESLFPKLKLREYTPHTPLRYWLAGGLKSWTLLPQAFFPAATKIDNLLLRVSHNFGSFVKIELEKCP